MEQLLVNPTRKELSLDLPQHFEDVLLLCPGVWNKLEYTSLEISRAFLTTDWTDKSNTHIYLDHQDTKEFGVANWAGFVKNPRMIDGELRGDLEIWDEPTARYLKEAGAKFGVSATLAGLEDEDKDSMRNFHFESFSIVTNPACKPAWINLSQEVGVENKKITGFEAVRNRMGWSVSKFYAAARDPPSSSKLPIFDAAHVRNALARFNQTQLSSEEKSKALSKIRSAAKKFGIKISKELDNDLSNNSTSLGDNQLNIGVNMEKKKLEEEKATEEESTEESTEEESSEEEKVVENEEESSEDDDESSEEESDEESEKELSGDLLKQLNSKFDRLLSVLEKQSLVHKGEYESTPQKKKVKNKEKSLDVVSSIRKELSEIKKQLVEGNKVKVERKTLAVSDSMIPDSSTNADQGMLSFLQRRI